MVATKATTLPQKQGTWSQSRDGPSSWLKQAHCAAAPRLSDWSGLTGVCRFAVTFALLLVDVVGVV